ncbi:MAG: hypothetical protein U0L45_03730 [Alistipes sp.]|nr:hypothetical protein [Alistipes sp.]
MDILEKRLQFDIYEGQRKSASGIGYADLKEECNKREQARKKFLAKNKTYTDTFNEEEALLFQCYYRVIDVVEKINNGCRIENINWHNVLCRGKSDNGEIRLFYELKILCWIINSFDDIAIKTAIIDIIYNQLQLQIVTDKNPTAECFLEYLPIYKGLLIAASTYTPAVSQQKQEQIYSIPTNLTEEQLRRILKSLKTERFVAPEQTEEDFLNSFEIEGIKPTKQGKINWIKQSRSRPDNPICKKAIVDFVYNILNIEIKGIELLHKSEAIFGVRISKSTVSNVVNSKAKTASEYSQELANIFAEIANI